jgi:hypothetical protein
MTFEPHKLDQIAHDLVLKYRDKKDGTVSVLNQSHKMRMTLAYGLERFWGESLRLDGNKAKYWQDTWEALHKILGESGIKLPNDKITSDRDTNAIKAMADKLWSFDIRQRKVALAVLTQLCDSMVWWTQRYKLTETSPGVAND